jgi:uncharacterized caspase-like protein
MEGSMRNCFLALATLVCAAFALNDASAFVVNKRVALVIGNSNYQHAVTLPNPVNDGKLMADTLRKAGFSVIEGSDLNKVDMGKLLDQFTEAAYDADIALVYYAGHGLQVDGHNYLIPIDAELEKPAQLQTRTIPVDDVLNALPPDPAVGVVILDACRDNPLARTLAAALPKSRSMGAGLAAVQANGLSHDAGGLLIAYATDPGSVAYDGTSEHSPYTTALAHNLTTPGLEIQSALTRVRAEVSEATNGAQRPWHNASLAREVYVGAAPAPETAKQEAPAAAGEGAAASAEPAGGEVDWTVEQKLWDEASKRNTVAHYELYLTQYPKGRFADVAKLNIDQLKEAEAAGGVQAATDADKPEQVALNMTPGSQSRTAVGVSDEVKQVPGTAETEAAIMLDRDGRIDLQLRLNALGYYSGAFDGSLGPRSRTAVGAWQHQNGIVQTTYLTPEQHMLMVVQSDPMMAQVRAQYEAQKAASVQKRNAPATTTTKTASKTTVKKKQQVATRTTPHRTTQTAKDDIPYRPRGTVQQGQPVDNSVGTFAAGALLGTGIGLAIGNH